MVKTWHYIDGLVMDWQIDTGLALDCRIANGLDWIGVRFLMNDGLVKDYQIGIGLGDYQRIGTVFLNSAMD